jgi:hypothetical protein
MTTQLTIEPVLDDISPGDPLIAHIITKNSQMRGYVFGEEVVALCGERFIPTRDPDRYPLCGTCREVAQRIMYPD